MTGYKIKNWGKYQHYKDRRPPWIKLYTEIIDDFRADGTPNDLYSLTDSAKLTLMLLWCLASRHDGVIPRIDSAWLALKTGMKKPDISPLLAAGFIETSDHASKDASKDASTDLDLDIDKDKRGLVSLPFESDNFKSAWKAWKEHRRRIRKPMTDRAQELILKKLPKDEATAIAWINNAIEKGWQGIYEPKQDGYGKTAQSSPSTKLYRIPAAKVREIAAGFRGTLDEVLAHRAEIESAVIVAGSKSVDLDVQAVCDLATTNTPSRTPPSRSP
jgi:hypothetical protein